VIKRTIEISREPAHLSVRLDQLLLKRRDDTIASFPCEDVGLVVVDHPQTTYTHGALAALARSQAALLICGADHLPLAMLLPLADHTEVVWRIHEQIAVSKPVRKRLWQQLVRAKILGQASNLAQGSPPHRKLLHLAQSVRSGDPMNCEAQAARIYWAAWLINVDQSEQPVRAFYRDPDGSGLNALLNYGYAILRAAVARALVAAGLLPVLGLHHSNRSNGFCLADDLVEPLRPIVDARARELYWAGHNELDQPTKAELLELLTVEVRTGTETGPLFVSLHRMVASLVKCYQGTSRDLEIPILCESADTAACGL